jgi:CDP-glycerol glycerophosphotransferase (TagB/SpsB family)
MEGWTMLKAADFIVDKISLDINELAVVFHGQIELADSRDCLRFNFLMQTDQDERLLPLHLKSYEYIDGVFEFSGRQTYQLDTVFYKQMRVGEIARIYIQVMDSSNHVSNLSTKVLQTECDQKLFSLVCEEDTWYLKRKSVSEELEKQMREPGKGQRMISWIYFIGAFLLVPVWLLHSLLAEIGIVSFKDDSIYHMSARSKRIAKNVNAFLKKFSSHIISTTAIKRNLFIIIYKFYCLKPVKKNSVLLLSVRRTDLTGNFAFVYKKLKKRRTLQVSTMLLGRDIKGLSFRQIFPIAKKCAGYKLIVLDDYTNLISKSFLRKETEVMQLWHAFGAFKTFGFSRAEVGENDSNVFQNMKNHRSYDYEIVSSENVRRCYAEGFGIPLSNVYATGIPRTDMFLNDKYKKDARDDFYTRYPQFKDKKIILFAPTFRGYKKADAYYPMNLFRVDEFMDKVGDEYVLLIKHHPYVKTKHPIPSEYRDRVVDMSNLSEVNMLLFVTDILITDYSSIIYEAALLNIPMIFYAFDLEEYTMERDFYFPYKQFIPGMAVKEQDRIAEVVVKQQFDYEQLQSFVEKYFNHLDGHASDRVTDLIEQAAMK